jgi:hypothetical protein
LWCKRALACCGNTALAQLLQVAVVLEPSTGDVFRKLTLRLLAAGLSGGIGILLLFFGERSLGCCRKTFRGALIAVPFQLFFC